MHCDALQIFTKNQKGDQGTRTRGGLFGLGVLIGGAAFAFGWERNCKKAEILAINDDGKEESVTQCFSNSYYLLLPDSNGTIPCVYNQCSSSS